MEHKSSQKSLFLSIFFAIVLYLFFLPLTQKAYSASYTLTNTSDFNTGLFSDTEADTSQGDLKIQSEGSWTTPPAAINQYPLPLTEGTIVGSDGDYMYVLSGRNSDFRRYLPDENRWDQLTNPPYSPGIYKGDMVYLDGYLYVIFSGYQKKFARYRVATDSWETLSDLPAYVHYGVSMDTDGTNIFIMRGTNTIDFWKYTVATDSFTDITSPPATMYYGSEIVYKDGYIYAIRGNNTTTLYRYDVSASTWSTRATAPLALRDDHNVVLVGDAIYVNRGYNSADFYRYNIGSNTWTTLTSTPTTNRYVGLVYVENDDQMYVFRGNNQRDVWKYDYSGNSFSDPAVMPVTISTGSDLVYHNGYLYMPRGTGSNFYRYNVSGNSWDTLSVSPNTMQWDGSGEVAGSIIYWARGSGATFYSYNTGTGSWSTLTDAPATLSNGVSVAYPGSGDYLYVSRGANTATMYRYSISGNTWGNDSDMADLPSPMRMSIGSRMTSDGTYVYALTAGSGPSRLYRYTIATDTWTDMGSLPFAPYYGTGLEYYNGKLYMLQGYYSKRVWEYDIGGQTWRRLEDFSGFYGSDVGSWAGATIESDGAGTFYATRGSLYERLHIYTSSTDNYRASGTWTSDAIDLTYVSAFGTLTSTETTPDDSSISYQTRSSADRITWSSWQSLSGSSIQSPAARYIQVKATLSASSDQSETPTLSDLTINYTSDSTAPSNPTSYTSLSQSSGGTAIVSGQTYSHVHPYFTWSGASDTESTIAGYYVYFGTNASASPQVSGTYQTGSTYIVTASMANDTYYLRIQTKDSADNVSAAETVFTYVYQGTTTQSLTYDDAEDLIPESTTNIATSGGTIRLQNQTGGYWSQTRATHAPAALDGGAGWAYVESTRKLYTFRGANTTTFYELDIDSNTWSTLAVAPATVRYGGQVVEGPSGYLYGLRGNNSTSFWRYTIASNTWSDSEAADPPSTIYTGGAILYDGDEYIYVMRGNNDNAFWRYSTDTDGWETLEDTTFDVATTVTRGGDMVYDGSGTIYAIAGNYRSDFSSYDTTSDSWTILPTLPHIADYGATLEYDRTQGAVYYSPGYARTFFYKYDVATQTWSELPEIPAATGYGSDLINIDGKLYLIRGANTTTIYIFDTVAEAWTIPTLNLFGTDYRGSNYLGFYYGADIEKGDGNYYYFTKGNYDSRFARYDSSTGDIRHLAQAPGGFYTGGDIAYESTNNRIYATFTTVNNEFWYYDIATDTWSRETSDDLPVVPGTGASLVYDGTRYIYYARGSGTTSFYRFDTQGTAGSKWSSLTNVTASLNYGAELVYKGDYIYTLRGGNVANNPFYRYDPAQDIWTTLTPLTMTVYNDGFLTDLGGDYLLACVGANRDDCFRYSISGDSWESIDDAPANIYLGGSVASNETDEVYVIAGSNGTNTFWNGLYSYVPESSTSGFYTSGSYYSQTHNLESVYKYANITLDYTSADDTTLAVYTRSSADGSDWDDWLLAAQELSNDSAYIYEIKSAIQQYVQVRFDLTSNNGKRSGVIDSYSINYYQDTLAPSNPTSITAYSTATQSATLTTNQWYNHSAPFFDWPDANDTGGASDTATGSGVIGYYVYFGTESDADPAEEGTFTADSDYTASGLTSGETYYLNIKSKDDALNTSDDSYAAFTYKFDNTPPTNNLPVNADPSGWSSTDEFSFSWPAASDSASLVAEYCYKTGESGSSETCTTGTSVTGLTSYQAGQNTFYVRAKDNAGNYASSYASVTYLYSSTAPSPPQNLTVSPSSNTINEFAFSWNAPASFFGSQAGIRYYYSVNAIPTAENVNLVGLTVPSLAAGAYATVPGQNIFYVVAKDEAGNIDYDLYNSVTFTANTTAPGLPRDMEIADVSVKSTSSWKLAVSWDEPTATGSGVANYRVYRSTTTGASCTTDLTDFTHIATTSEASYVSSGLTQQTYYFCSKACDNTGNCSAPGDTVSMYPDGRWTNAPDLVASPSATVKTRTAAISWSTNRTSNSFVKYGTSSGEYGEEVGSSEQVTLHEVSLDLLDPGTTYYYKALWTDEDGNLGESDELTLTTNPAPLVSQVKATDVSINSAIITATITHATTASLQYGKTTAYGGTMPIPVSTSGGTYTIILEELDEDAEYHYRIVAEDDDGNEYLGEDHLFQTLPIPRILNLKVQQVAGLPTATIRLIWSTNTETSSIVTYYPSSSPELAQDKVSLVRRTIHDVLITGLLDEQDYTILIKGKDIANNDVQTETRKLTTAADLRPPSIADMTVESTIIGVGESAKAQIIVCWNTDEPATTHVEYGVGTSGNFGSKTQEDTNLTNDHCVTIAGAEPATIYQVRAVSKDKANNVATSPDTVIVTPNATRDALNLVIDRLSKTFGFLKGLQKATE